MRFLKLELRLAPLWGREMLQWRKLSLVHSDASKARNRSGTNVRFKMRVCVYVYVCVCVYVYMYVYVYVHVCVCVCGRVWPCCSVAVGLWGCEAVWL